MNYQEVRAAVEPIKRKINEGQNITAAELTLLHKHAQGNPNANTIGLYAIGKRHVKDEDNEE